MNITAVIIAAVIVGRTGEIGRLLLWCTESCGYGI